MNLCIKAGNKAFELLASGSFNLDRITTYVGPAVGPRWLIASGFDLTLLETGALGNAAPVLLSGASAGAWRFAAWLQPEPIKSYWKLIEAYISQSYTREDNPQTVMLALSRIIDAYIDTDALPFVLTNKRYRLSVITARAKHLVGSEWPWIQKLGLAAALAGNALSPSLVYRFFERVVFYYAPLPPRFCLRKDFRGKAIPLNAVNFKDAVIASGAIPLLVAGIRNIYGSPNGVYRDGGLLDYHLNEQYANKDGDLVLLFHHQERIIPGWLDKKLKSRGASSDLLENVLMVYPSEEFIKKLPNGKVPDRDDFVAFVDKPNERTALWRKTVTACESFGEQFLELVHSGKLRDRVQKF
jgi:hypothetical protein